VTGPPVISSACPNLESQKIYTLLENLSTGNFNNNLGRISGERGGG
jgi:hypothetical protein